MERAGAHNRPQGGRKTFFGHHISEIKFVLNFKQRLRTRAFVFFTLAAEIQRVGESLRAFPFPCLAHCSCDWNQPQGI